MIPERGSETFISTIGHLDGRIDLYKRDDLVKEVGDSASGEQALMDLCIIAAKLAYENANVIRNIVVHHWKACYFNFFFSFPPLLLFISSDRIKSSTNFS